MRDEAQGRTMVITRNLSGVLAIWPILLAVFLVICVAPSLVMAANPMIHSSQSTGSTKWPTAQSGKAVDGWGITDAQYGEFTCGTCHARNTGNIKRVKATITTPDSSNWEGPVSPNVTVNFQSVSGASSFGDDGRAVLTESNLVCEVCHSQTAVHRYDSSGIADFNHKNANQTDCMICHPHKIGFTPLQCDSCHGFPPTTNDNNGSTSTGLAFNPVTTGSVTAGAHAKHAVGLGYDCENCHLGYVMPNAGDIDIHFSNFGSVTGTYSGQLTADYNGSAGTGGLTCNTVYCHSTGQSSTGSSATPSAYSAPAWNGTVTCGSCHDANDPGTGSHTAHISDGADCGACHLDAVAGSTAPTGVHVNRVMNVYNSAVGDLGYTAGGAPGNGYGTCNSINCHDDGRNGGVTPTWGAMVANCAECHAVQPATGSHSTHLALFNCGTCHDGAVESSNGGTSHRSGDVNILASTGLASPRTLGDTFTSCGTNNCHGSNSPVWGTDLSANDQCTQCHGQLVAGPAADSQKAPGGSGVDTNGDSLATDVQVGAHQIHLNPTMSKAVACSACHTVPGTVTAVGHIDSALPAELTWSGTATANSTTPTSCATTYCHDGAAIKNGWDGGTLAPVWTSTNFVQGSVADCDNCHGYPPAGGHPADNPTIGCNGCHNNVTSGVNSFTFTDKSLHVDGTVQASGGDTCIDCHSALNAAHDKHTDEATILGTAKLSVEGYGGQANWYSATYVSGKPNFGCGLCHPKSDAAHMTGSPTVNLAWDDTGATGSLKANNGNAASYAGAGGGCSQVYCHSDGLATAVRVYGWQNSPNWSGGTVSGACNDCHGNSPTSNAHSLHAVGIHYDTLTAAGSAGLMAASGASGSGAAHGDTATADTIGCQSCHADTVAVEYNAGNSICGSCHSDTNAPATGNELAIINTAGSTHVNGQADVAFVSLAGFKSKAQVRNDITTVTELDNSWARYNTAGLDNTAYKQVNSFDAALNAAPVYNSTLMSCSTVDCHNGNAATWGDVNVSCEYCHTSLPQ